MITRFNFVIIIAFIVCLFACKKKDSDKPLTKADFLTTGSWKLVAVVSDEDGDAVYETNTFADFETCYTDNIWTFHSNGTLTMDEGNSKCDVNDPQSNETDWKLTNNETTLVIHLDAWSIQELTSTSLIWKESYSDNRSTLVTFSKQ